MPTKAPATPKKAKLTWPAGTPTWQKTILETLAAHTELASIPPQVMAAIAQIESGFENAGAGVNSSGYGGYFGLGATHHYRGGTPSRAVLETNSPTSFRLQARLAATTLDTYVIQVITVGHVTGSSDSQLIAAVNHYVNGGSLTNTNPQGSPDAANVFKVLKGGTVTLQEAQGMGSTAGGAKATTFGLGGVFGALTTIATDIGYLHDLTFWKRVGIFLGGAALLGVGIFLLAQQSPGVRKVESTAATAAAV